MYKRQGETFGFFAFLLLWRRTSNVLANLRVILPERPYALLLWEALRVSANHARTVVETFLASNADRIDLVSRIEIAGIDKLNEALRDNKGVILVTAHIGNWELPGVALARMGYKITTVAGVQFTRGLTPLLKKMKETVGIKVTNHLESAGPILRALRKGEIVALHIDGDQYGERVQVKLFGRETYMPKGPARLARLTGAHLIPAIAVRVKRRKIRLEILDEISTKVDETEITQSIAMILETYIRTYPNQWCIFRRIWL